MGDEIFLITNANMNEKAGDIALIERRAKAIYEISGSKTICLLLNHEQLTEGEEYIEYNFISNDKSKLKNELIKKKPIKIIFYGERSFKYINIVRKTLELENIKTEIIIDIQGAIEEIIEFKNGLEKLISYPKFIVKKKLLKNAVISSDSAFIVSDEMEKYIIELCGNKLKKKYIFYKVRCGIEKLISFEEKTKWRSMTRESLDLDSDTNVFVFSGYRRAWQKLDEILSVFQYYDHNIDNMFFAIFCDVDEEFSRKIREMFPKGNYILKLLDKDDYFKYLTACDVGFLIRDYNVTNRVAFPNKFADYLNAGLTLAMNDSVVEPFKIMNNYDIEYIDTSNIYNIDKVKKILLNRRLNLHRYYQITESVSEKELSYENQLKEERFI